MDTGFSLSALNLDLNTPNNAFDPARAGGLSPASERVGGNTTDFATTLEGLASSFSDTMKNAEAMSIAGVKGEAGAYEVASAVMEAEQALRMTISVRDKIVQAYLEITRMQI